MSDHVMGDSGLGFAAWAQRYFAAKAGHDLDTLTGLFHPVIDYEDAVLCRRTHGAQRMRATYQHIFERAPASAGSSLAWSAGSGSGSPALTESAPYICWPISETARSLSRSARK